MALTILRCFLLLELLEESLTKKQQLKGENIVTLELKRVLQWDPGRDKNFLPKSSKEHLAAYSVSHTWLVI